MPLWNPPSSLVAPGPSPAHQPVGISTRMPQAKQLAGQGHSPTYHQTGCLKTPRAHSLLRTQSCPLESPGHCSTHKCTGISPRTPGPSPPSRRQTPARRYLGLFSQLPRGPAPLTSRPAPALGHTGICNQPHVPAGQH